MPRGRRNKESSPPLPPSSPPTEEEAEAEEQEEQDDEEMQGDDDGDGVRALQFDQPLTWRAGKPIAVAELLRRLDTLCNELQSLEQEDVDRDSIVPTAQELASPLLLKHKDNGVKAFTLWCIVEMFRLLAPDAPYKQSQLKDVFGLFVSNVIPALANPSDPYNGPHLRVLESLVSVKSIILLTDLPGSDALMINLFTNCFDVLAGNARGGGEQLSKNVEFNMTGMLTILIDESGALPSGVIDILLAQFLRADPSVVAGPGNKKGTAAAASSLPRDVSPAYGMAKSVCNSCEDKMIRYIGQYFHSVLIDANETFATPKPSSKSKGKKRTRDESDDESDVGLPAAPSDTDLEEVGKAHRLLRELWRSCPEVIRNVLPQIEAEVGGETLPLRVMAVETVGDMISGIGAAGPPPPRALDPIAFPSQSLENSASPAPAPQSVLLTPAAPHAFSSVFPSAYQAFFDRHRDKAAQVRSAWTTAVGQIILTSGGGKGLDQEQESRLLQSFSDMLVDQDEKVRLATVQAISHFDFNSILQKLSHNGGVTTPGSLLSNLADRIKDPKQSVRNAAVELLARLWGVAAGAIAEDRERVRDLLGAIPSKIFLAFYINDKALNAVVERVYFESLLPIGFPPIKSKPAANGDSQRIPNSQGTEDRAPNPDQIRVERILVLVRDLEEKAKPVFFSLQKRQASHAKYIEKVLENVQQSGDKKTLERLFTLMSHQFPDPSIASYHFEKMFEHHDKRNFSLLNFCISPESEYRKVVNAMKELTKRLEQAPAGIPSSLESVTPFLRVASLLLYNRSHVPAILDISRTDEKGLGSAAHELLKDISVQAPEVFKVHIQDLCESLKKQAPSPTTPNDPTAVDSLKACAGFARAGHFPEKMRKDREFYQAMVKFAIHGTPPRAAKHAVTITVAAAEKKEMYIKEILKTCTTNFQPGSEGSLSKLAALSQLRLLASEEIEDRDDALTEIATAVLTTGTNDADHMDMDSSSTDVVDEGLDAKLWALKGIVNSLRGQIPADGQDLNSETKSLSERVFKLLNTIVESEGELSKTENTTSEQHRSQLRLSAAKLLLKLCCNKTLERGFKPRDFNRLIKIVQDPLPLVRARFNGALRKYLSLDKIHRRFYGLVFLYAFEPVKETKERTTTFLKARAAKYAKAGDSTMQSVFAWLVSILAHHQDFSPAAEDLEDFISYILFYLKIVGTEKNLPEIYSIVQRIKTVQDGIDPERSENLYVLSDLAEAMIRQYADLQGWSLQIVSQRARLPPGLYAGLPSHAAMQEITEKRWLPPELAENLEDLVRDGMRRRKRKSGDTPSHKASKKARTSTTTTTITSEKFKPSANGRTSSRPSKQPKAPRPAKTPKKRVNEPAPSSERRKSARASNAKSYAEHDESEDDEELERWQNELDEEGEGEDADEDEDEDEGEGEGEGEGEESVDEEGNKENVGSSTPPTSDPTPLPPSLPEKEAPSSKEKKTPRKRGAQRNATTTTAAAATTSGKKQKPEMKQQEQLRRGGRATRTSARNAAKTATPTTDAFEDPDESD